MLTNVTEFCALMLRNAYRKRNKKNASKIPFEQIAISAIRYIKTPENGD
jgi:hypothetical protein